MALESSGTILYVAKFRINRITDLEIVRGDQNFTHAHRHTHTEAYFVSPVFLRKCRNKTKNAVHASVHLNFGISRSLLDSCLDCRAHEIIRHIHNRKVLLITKSTMCARALSWRMIGPATSNWSRLLCIFFYLFYLFIFATLLLLWL